MAAATSAAKTLHTGRWRGEDTIRYVISAAVYASHSRLTGFLPTDFLPKIRVRAYPASEGVPGLDIKNAWSRSLPTVTMQIGTPVNSVMRFK